MSEDIEERSVKLPRHIWIWLDNIAKARGEDINEVLSKVLSIMYSFYVMTVLTPSLNQMMPQTASQLLTDCDELFEEFKNYLITEKKLSDKNIDGAISIARRISEFNGNCTNINDEIIEKFLNTLNVTKSTRDLYKYYLNLFKQFLAISKSEAQK